MYLFKLEFSSFLDICPGVGLLDHMVTLRNHHTVLHSGCTLTFHLKNGCLCFHCRAPLTGSPPWPSSRSSEICFLLVSKPCPHPLYGGHGGMQLWCLPGTYVAWGFAPAQVFCERQNHGYVYKLKQNQYEWKKYISYFTEYAVSMSPVPDRQTYGEMFAGCPRLQNKQTNKQVDSGLLVS